MLFCMDNIFIFNMKLSGFMPYYEHLLWSTLLVGGRGGREEKKKAMNIHIKHSRYKPLTNPVKWNPGNTEVTAHATPVVMTCLANLLNSGSTLNWTPFQKSMFTQD